MSTCKKCGKIIPILASMCEDCIKQQKELEIEEQRNVDETKRIETEEKLQRLKEETKTTIADIIKLTTDDEPLFYSFIQNDVNVIEKKSIAGTLVGGALGGIAGAAMGGTFDKSRYEYHGKYGILIVTNKMIIIKTIYTDTLYPNIISYLQLKQLLSKSTNLNTIKCLIEGSQIFQNKIIESSKETITFSTCKLYLDNSNPYQLPDQHDFVTICEKLGSLITVDSFIKKLKKGESPMNDLQLNSAITSDKKYFNKVFSKIIYDKNQKVLIENFSFLIPSIRKVLVSIMKEKAKPSDLLILISIVLGIIPISCIIFSIYLFIVSEFAEAVGISCILLFPILVTSAIIYENIFRYQTAEMLREIIINNKMETDEYLNAPSKIRTTNSEFIDETKNNYSPNEIKKILESPNQELAILTKIDEETKESIKQMNRNEAIEFCIEKFNLSIKDAKRLINEIV